MTGLRFDYSIAGLGLVLTCSACPEQYDVFDGRGRKVAYFRLRHGMFRADVSDAGGTTVYRAEPKGDGSFDDDERMRYLTEAVRAVKRHRAKAPSP